MFFAGISAITGFDANDFNCNPDEWIGKQVHVKMCTREYCVQCTQTQKYIFLQAKKIYDGVCFSVNEAVRYEHKNSATLYIKLLSTNRLFIYFMALQIVFDTHKRMLLKSKHTAQTREKNPEE